MCVYQFLLHNRFSVFLSVGFLKWDYNIRLGCDVNFVLLFPHYIVYGDPLMGNQTCLSKTIFLFISIYSRTSVAKTLMLVYHGCFELILMSLGKNPLPAVLG